MTTLRMAVLAAGAATVILALTPSSATGAIVEVFPTDTEATINGKIAGLDPGDMCLFHAGYYDLGHVLASGIAGNAGAWITIKPFGDGNVHIHGNSPTTRNTVDLDNVSYLRFQGFEISGGSDGIKFNAGTSSSHVIIEDCHIHDVGDVGINSKATTFPFLEIRRCQVHATGGTGEGMYLGAQDGSDIVSDTLIEGNWVHHTGGTQGDGIEVKRGSYRVALQDNVVHDTANGFPGITLYRTDRNNIADNSVIRRNAVWNAGEGIFASAETTIENNLVFACDYGINVRDYFSIGVRDLLIRNNTIFSCSTTCLRLSNWNVGSGAMSAINNACFQTSSAAAANQAPNGLGGATVSGNRHYGTSALGTGSTVANPPAAEFVNSVTTPGTVSLYPRGGSSLVNAGTDLTGSLLDDFNRLSRPLPVGEMYDVGAYEYTSAANPGWAIQAGFKPLTPAQTTAKGWSRWDGTTDSIQGG